MAIIRHKQRAITAVTPTPGQGRWINPNKASRGPIEADFYISSEATNGYDIGVDTNDGTSPTDEGGGVGPWLTLNNLDTHATGGTFAVNGSSVVYSGVLSTNGIRVSLGSPVEIIAQVPFATTITRQGVDNAQLFRVNTDKILIVGKVIIDPSAGITTAVARIQNTQSSGLIHYKGTRFTGTIPAVGGVALSESTDITGDGDTKKLTMEGVSFVNATGTGFVVSWTVKAGTVSINDLDLGNYTITGAADQSLLTFFGKKAIPADVTIVGLNGNITLTDAIGAKRILRLIDADGFNVSGTRSLIIDATAQDSAGLAYAMEARSSIPPEESPYPNIATVAGNFFDNTGIVLKCNPTLAEGIQPALYGIIGGRDAISSGLTGTQQDSLGAVHIFDCEISVISGASGFTSGHNFMIGGKTDCSIKRCRSEGGRHNFISKVATGCMIQSCLSVNATQDGFFHKGSITSGIVQCTHVVTALYQNISGGEVESMGNTDGDSFRGCVDNYCYNNSLIIEVGATWDGAGMAEGNINEALNPTVSNVGDNIWRNSNYWDDNAALGLAFTKNGTSGTGGDMSLPTSPDDFTAFSENNVAGGYPQDDVLDVTAVDPVLSTTTYRPTAGSPAAINSGGFKWWTIEEHKDLSGVDFLDPPSVGCYQSKF